jgi:hypothetical protein
MNRSAALTLFLLKTRYFSAVNNPLFVIILAVGVVLFFGDSLGKHEMVLLLYMIGCTHVFLPKGYQNRTDVNQTTADLSFALLPVCAYEFVKSALTASVVYGFVFMTAFTLLLYHVERLPEFIYPPRHNTRIAVSGDTIQEVTGTIVGKVGSGLGWRNVNRKITIQLAPTFLFRTLPSSDIQPVIYIALTMVLFFIIDTIRFCSRYLLPQHPSSRFLDYYLIGIQALYCLIIIADVVLPPMVIRIAVDMYRQHPEIMYGGLWVTFMVVLARIAFFVQDFIQSRDMKSYAI